MSFQSEQCKVSSIQRQLMSTLKLTPPPEKYRSFKQTQEPKTATARGIHGKGPLSGPKVDLMKVSLIELMSNATIPPPPNLMDLMDFPQEDPKEDTVWDGPPTGFKNEQGVEEFPNGIVDNVDIYKFFVLTGGRALL